MKVARIINKYYVVVSAGQYDVKRGDLLEIYSQGDIEIFDPDTNESLGTLDYVKATVEVEDVFPKMCVCKNTEYREESPLMSSISALGSRKVINELNVDENDISGGWANINKKIKVGDLVRKPLGE